MSNGVLENGVFYFGARERVMLPPKEPDPEPVVGVYDAELPDEINARRYFGFSDYGEIDIYLLRGRRNRIRMSFHEDWYKLLLHEAK